MPTVVYIIIPPIVALIGGIVGIIRPPGAKLRSAVQHLAAGLVFAAVAVEILPDVKHQQAPFPVIAGAILGILGMLALRWFTQRFENRQDQASGTLPLGLIVTMGIDVFIDGMLTGIGFSAGAATGVLLTFALGAEIFFLGLTVATTVNKEGDAKGRAVLVSGVIGVSFFVGAVLGVTIFSAVSATVLTIALSFGLIALLYLVTEELLVEAHEVPDTPFSAASFFIGFILLLVVTMISERGG